MGGRLRGAFRYRSRMGGASNAVFRLLPGGPDHSLIAAGQLSGSKGEPVTFTRASSAVCENASGGLTTLAANLPRVESTGLRVEGGATNLALWSQDATQASWGKSNVTVTADASVAPDGTTTADRLAADSVTHAVSQPITVSASTSYVFSFYVKNNGGTVASYSIYDRIGAANIVAPTPYFSQISGTAWTRISVPFTTPVGCTSVNVYFLRDSGAATADILVWGAQLETGSTATSYIPTTGTSASRSADVATVSAAGWPTAAGSVEVTYTPLASGNPAALAYLLDTRSGTGATDSGIALYVDTTGALVFLSRAAGTQLNSLSDPLTWTAGTQYRIRAVWTGAGNLSLYRNDALVKSVTDGTQPVPASHRATANIGSNLNSVNQMSGNLHSLSVRR